MGLCEMGTVCRSENGDSDRDLQGRISQMGEVVGSWWDTGVSRIKPLVQDLQCYPSLSGCVGA